MGASRENMSLWVNLSGVFRSDRLLPKRYHIDRLSRNLWILFNPRLKTIDKWYREMIIKDSFITPYHQIIGCRVFGHNWSTKEDSIRYDFSNDRVHCWKCSKWSTRSDIRNSRINKILK